MSRLKSACGGHAALLLLSFITSLQAQSVPDPPPNIFHRTATAPPPVSSTNVGAAGTTGNGITLHGGPVILGVTNIYYIWYGNWSVAPNAVPILQTFATSIGGSPYFAINTTYYNSQSTPVSNAVAFNGSTTDNYSQGVTLSDAGVLAVVSSAITSGRLPKDTNGVYFVLTSPDVHESSGFITQYCGWHDNATVAGSDIKYAFVGDAATQGIGSCAAQTSISPNADVGVDAMVSVVAHELEEAVTDPDLNAWFDSMGNENADKCAWTFGTTYSVSNGSFANMNLGGRDYLIQRNWVNASGGYCALALPPAITSLSPGSGAAGSSVPVLINGSNLKGGTVTVSGTGVTAVVTSSSATQIAATLTIGASAVAGARNVSVTTVGGTSGTQAFTVTGAAGSPVLTSISPSSGTQGQAVPVTITGSNFIAGATVGVSGTGVTAGSVVVVSGTSITATLTIAAGAVTGSYNVTVTTTGGTSGPVAFTVNAASGTAPTITGISPGSGAQGQVVPVTITGTNFLPGATVGVRGGGVTQNNFVVVSSTQMTATFTISASAVLGVDTVTVSTSAGVSNTFPFNVVASGIPSISNISPSSGVQGQTVPITITGSNFIAGATVGVSGTGVAAGSVVVVNSTSITATLTVAANAATGAHGVTVTTTAGTTSPATFTVAQAPPTITNINPSTGVQGQAVPITITGSNFIAGATVGVSGTGVTAGSIVVVNGSSITATLTIAANAATGAYGITVTTTAGTTSPATFTVTQAPPTITNIAPSTGVQGQAVPITITGTNFITGATVGVSGTGVTAGSIVVVNSSSITATLTIAANAATGAYGVTVTTTAGTTSPTTFTVTQAPPTITNIAPSTGVQGQAVPITITGTNFMAGATVGVSGTGVTAGSIVVVNGNSITATLTIAANAATGAYGVTVTTTAGTTSPATFTVTQAPPTITNISPSTGVQGQAVPITITGSNFIAGATVGVSGAGVTPGSVVVVDSSNITATLTIAANATTGTYGVTVTTTGGTTSPTTFTVTQAPPTITNVSPSTGVQGQAVPITITGTNFMAGATVGVSGTGVTAGSVVVVDSSNITATLTIAANAATGAYSVTVTTSGGTTTPATFTVTQAPPAITNISPSSGVQGQAVPMTITGSNFTAGATVAVSGTGVTPGSVVAVNSSTITATLTIAANAATGAYSVTVTTMAGTTSPATFTVTQAPPTITNISPSSGVQGQAVPITITGSNFIAGATVAVSGTGVTPGSVVVVNSTSITATLTIAANAVIGAYGVTVTTVGGTTTPATFTATQAPPTITNISPSSGVQGQAVPITITGTNFMAGATVGVSGTGVTAGSIVVVNSNSITATLTIAANAVTGAYGVTVTTVGGITSPATFTVTALSAVPSITNIAPSSGVQGQAVPVTITGNNFMAGATVAVSGPGVTAGSVVVVNNTSITVTLTLAANAATGSHNVTVTTSGGISNAATFTVNAAVSGAPVITSISPASGLRGQIVTITINGANFLPGTIVGVAGPGVKQGNFVIISSTQMTATLTISPSAFVGDDTVTVRTSVGTSNGGIFTVQ